MTERCPVCEGRGIVPGHFYDLTPYQGTGVKGPTMCRSCNGGGVLVAGCPVRPVVEQPIRPEVGNDPAAGNTWGTGRWGNILA